MRGIALSTLAALILAVVAIIILWMFVTNSVSLAEHLINQLSGRIREMFCQRLGLGFLCGFIK